MCLSGRCSTCQHAAIDAGINHHDLTAVMRLEASPKIEPRDPWHEATSFPPSEAERDAQRAEQQRRTAEIALGRRAKSDARYPK